MASVPQAVALSVSDVKTPAPVFERARPVERIVAYVLDLVPMIALEMIPLGIPQLLASAYILLRDALFGGQSVGKKLLGIRVVTIADARGASVRESILRNFPLALGFLLPIIPIVGHVLGAGFALFVFVTEAIAIMSDKRGRRLGDKLAGTIVVRAAMREYGVAESLALVGRLTGLPFLIGIKPYATLFGFGLLLALGYVTDPFFLHPSFSIFANPFILILLGALFLVDTLADKVLVFGHINDMIDLVVKPLAAVIVSFLAVGAVDVDQNRGLAAIAFAVAGGTGISLSAHLTNMAARVGSTRTTRGLANPAVSAIGDFMALSGTLLLVRHPALVGFSVLVFLGVFAYFAPRLFRTIWSMVKAPFRLFGYWLGIGHAASEEVDPSIR